jgi:hypothetical protein
MKPLPCRRFCVIFIRVRRRRSRKRKSETEELLLLPLYFLKCNFWSAQVDEGPLSFVWALASSQRLRGLTHFFIFNLWPKKRSPRSLIKCESGGNKGFAPAGLPNPLGGPLISLIDSPLRSLSTDGGARQSAKRQSKWFYIKSRGLPGNAFRAPVARLLSSPAERQISRHAHPSQIIAAFVSAAGVPRRQSRGISARASERKTEMSKWVSCGVMEWLLCHVLIQYVCERAEDVSKLSQNFSSLLRIPPCICIPTPQDGWDESFRATESLQK